MSSKIIATWRYTYHLTGHDKRFEWLEYVFEGQDDPNSGNIHKKIATMHRTDEFGIRIDSYVREEGYSRYKSEL